MGGIQGGGAVAKTRQKRPTRDYNTYVSCARVVCVLTNFEVGNKLFAVMVLVRLFLGGILYNYYYLPIQYRRN